MAINPSSTATGSIQRVRLKLGGLVLHATIIPGSYSTSTGAFQASFDVDVKGTSPGEFVPVSPATTPPTYRDEDGNVWELVN